LLVDSDVASPGVLSRPSGRDAGGPAGRWRDAAMLGEHHDRQERACFVTRIGRAGSGSRAHPSRLMLGEHHVALESARRLGPQIGPADWARGAR